MAIPHDPYFSTVELQRLNAAFRALGLSKAAVKDVAAYIASVDVKPANVQAWLAPAVAAGTVGKPWADDFTKKEMLATLARIEKPELRAVFVPLGLPAPALRWNKKKLLAELTRGKDKYGIGATLDRLRPRQAAQEDALPDATYIDSYLSDYRRGTTDRRRADVVLALLGEVFQTPEAGGVVQDFNRRFFSIDDADEEIIWRLRNGTWPNKFIKEAWFKQKLEREPKGWLVTVWYYADVSSEGAGKFEDTGEGWPTRDNWTEARKERIKREKKKAAKAKARRQETKARRKGR